MDIKPAQILKAVQGKLLASPPDEFTEINKVCTDTRALEKGDVFFALQGRSFDGHDFLKEALEKGAGSLVISDAKKVPASAKRSAGVIAVQDTLKAYGDLAKLYRQKFKVPVIAVTGSCGKTTVKEMIAHILSKRFKVLKNRGTENNRVGVPKTLFQLDASYEAAVIEMGTNISGEIQELSRITAPQIGVITQIGSSHLEGLKSLEGVRLEKLSLMNSLERGGLLILNGEDPLLADTQSGVHRVLKVGFKRETHDLAAEQFWCHEKGSSFYVEKNLFETPLLGRHNILNCLFSILVCSSLGVKFSIIREGVASFKPPSGRLSFKEIAGVRFLDDTYNANPTSFKAALETLKEFKIREKKEVVCGDMLELGGVAEECHRQLGALMADHLPDFIIAAGVLSKALVDEALKKGYDSKRIYHVKDSTEAGKVCRQIAAPGDCVLVKGSRAMAMEKVFECFITSSIP